MSPTPRFKAEEVVDGAPVSLQKRLAAIGLADAPVVSFLTDTIPEGSRTYLIEVGALGAEDGSFTDLGRAAIAVAARVHAGERADERPPGARGARRIGEPGEALLDGVSDALLRHRGSSVIDLDGDEIGTLEEIYVDEATGEPEWALVDTGTIGAGSNFLPLSGAEAAGDHLRVSYRRDTVKDAPSIDADAHLDVDEERELYRYYGIPIGSSVPQEGVRVREGGTERGHDEDVQQEQTVIEQRRDRRR